MSDCTLSIPVPSTFLKGQFPMRAAELAFGHARGWIKPHDVVDALAWWWGEGAKLDACDVQIASLLPDELWKLQQLLDASTGSQGVSEAAARSLWLYLLLAWLFEIRDRLEDPLGAVESVYCDFSHPREIEKLIKYMPAGEGGPVGETGLIERWREFVERRRQELAHDRGVRPSSGGA